MTGGLPQSWTLDASLDPGSCYHETLPIVLQGDYQTLVVSENERGGSLISIPIDEEREIDRETDGFGIATLSDFMERYRREAGVPKAAAVLEVQGPDLR